MEAAAHDCARMAARAAEIGVLIHLEPVPFMDIKDAVMAMEIIDQVGHPNLGIQIDSWHHLRGPLVGAPKSPITQQNMIAACETLAGMDGDKILAVQICDSGPAQGHPFEDTMKRRLLPVKGSFHWLSYWPLCGRPVAERQCQLKFFPTRKPRNSKNSPPEKPPNKPEQYSKKLTICCGTELTGFSPRTQLCPCF